MIEVSLEILKNLSSLAKTREGNLSFRELNKRLKAMRKDKQHDNNNTVKILATLDDIASKANISVMCPSSKSDLMKLIQNCKDVARDNLKK